MKARISQISDAGDVGGDHPGNGGPRPQAPPPQQPEPQQKRERPDRPRLSPDARKRLQEGRQEGRIAEIKQALKLNDAQLKLWAPVEQQLRARFAARRAGAAGLRAAHGAAAPAGRHRRAPVAA